MESNQPEVFIAYRSFDRSAAGVLAQRLQEAGIETWLDSINLSPGDSWNVALETALKRCRVCLILIGVHNTSSHIIHEAYNLRADESRDEPRDSFDLAAALPNSGMLQAIERRLSQGNFSVIPVLLPGTSRDQLTQLPAFMQKLQWIEFLHSLDDERAYKRLLDAILIYTTNRLSDKSTIDLTEESAQATASTHIESTSTKGAITIKKIICFPDIDWVEIPAGAFVYGEKGEERRLDLERFYIGRYPITNVQYQTFIEAGGYQDERWWQDLIKPKPKKPSWKQPNRPRETVNWYEAVAFTRWLSAQLGYTITLPTEAQWEKAARGDNGRDYPWGNRFQSGDANAHEVPAGKKDNLRQTTAVGMYMHRQSSYGVADMAGNVWEWCLNKYHEPAKLEPDDSGDVRVLRGGSWYDDPELARSASRSRNNPDDRYFNIGFRVVSSSPHTER
jgi:formylglycine-generating enzyme required for sulfatase activity